MIPGLKNTKRYVVVIERHTEQSAVDHFVQSPALPFRSTTPKMEVSAVLGAGEILNFGNALRLPATFYAKFYQALGAAFSVSSKFHIKHGSENIHIELKLETKRSYGLRIKKYSNSKN